MVQMMAVVTTGNGGFEVLDYRAVPRPDPGPGEVRLKVLAAGVNNTEINTRLGWYAADVTGATQDTGGATRADGGWNAATPFPFIQGTDCCGRVERVGDGVDPARLGERVIVRACMRPNGFEDPENTWMGSDFDGAFAQYVIVPATEAFAVSCDWSDAELASIPCAYGTSENMLHRANLGAGETVLVTGASGGVGSATVQLAKRRGARVIAVTSPSKAEALRALGADVIIGRDAAIEEQSVDLVVDNVAGPRFRAMLKAL
ncbi:MAG: alcohol dehydrogenase catalytic domain-containing protein, partial [Pseudomonadota bacterium]